MVVAPDHMRKWFLGEVERAIEAKRSGEHARIVLKMNSLVDARCIGRCTRHRRPACRSICVRGICCLRPRVPGISDNITVVSVVGRFLEHSRIYGFERGDEREYWIGSPDLMPRNLDTRVELLAPVVEESLRAELADTLERYLADDTYGWELSAHGDWTRRTGGTRSVHQELMERALERARSASSWRFSARTRAAPSRMRSRNAGSRRATFSRRGYTAFQLAEPVIRIRSAPARIDRSAAVATPDRASTAAASRLSVTITPRKPSRPRSRPVTIGARLRRDPAPVQSRVARMREHHERNRPPRWRLGTGRGPARPDC